MADAAKLDLDEDKQRELLALDARVTSGTLFDVLGVSPSASAEEVRAAFREASRKYHPDRFFGKNLGSYRAILDRIFKKLVEANQTLSDPTKREAYLAANPTLRASVAKAEAPAPKTKLELSRDAERRDRLMRHPYLAKVGKIQEAMAKAKGHVAKAEFSQAFTVLNTVAQLDPGNLEISTFLAEVRRKAESARSDTSYAHALEALNRGDRALALSALRTAVSANPANYLAAAKASEIAEGTGDIKEATAFAQRAVDGAPTNVEYRLALARLLEQAGMKAMAKKQFEEALRLAPDHPEVKKHGKRLWPF